MSDEYLGELDEEIRKTKEEIAVINGDLKEKERLERRKESLIEKISHLSVMKRKYLEGLEKGKKEGIKQAKEEIAKDLILNDLDDELISKYTGLSLEEIKELRNN